MTGRACGSARPTTRRSWRPATRSYGWQLPDDEWDAITLNYTSGTTGDPKGVVYHHRGAALLALGNVITGGLGQHPVYLWTLPMFHCNGWCFPWTLSIVAGTHVCLRQVRAEAMYRLMDAHAVTHLCGAPIVMQMLINAPDAERRDLPRRVAFFTAAAPPPEAVLAGMSEAGFDVTHLYGLTESYGPAVVNAWHADWDALAADQRAAKKARQGVRYPVLEALDVRDPETLEPVPADGTTIGEVMMRGNVVMRGYLKNPRGHAGRLRGRLVPHRRSRGEARGRLHPAQGPLEGHHHLGRREHLVDRGRGRAVQASGGGGRRGGGQARSRNGARAPCAFVELKPGASPSADELIQWCRGRLASYKLPRHVVFGELPKTSTGKVQKFLLRARAREDEA